jgi:GNAT superfamily N-acetyltransferase
MPDIRSMREEDVEAVHDLSVETFEELDRRAGRPPDPRPDPAVAHIRYRHLLHADPDGAWVAEDERGLAGCALALRREDLWGLSLLLVRPDLQSAGVGSALLRRASAYAEGARGRIVLSSQDPRAIRAYARLGLAAHPALHAVGRARDVAATDGIREGSAADIPFTEAVDRHVRGAAHGPDIGAQLAMGQNLLIAPERGYAVYGDDGDLRLLAAFDEEAAEALLRAALARGATTVWWLTALQQWAIRVCVEAGLELRSDSGLVFVDGDVGRFHPYLPSGAFL